ncbi:mitochondrial carrier domain-containing protein [Pelagophyceae sp. CCMP2097]|nr:mitochondrial carrier domain-containing protein [Pelagophyceae sp. CCMP2097]|mmetsp:Transcript_20280/g.68731  ORF Transcript_20280/g.68731 Transcript_20280/m.68731 type:complete len:288 (+) Transcript_20280:29-892(+)
MGWLARTVKSAIGGGVPGALAMVLQIVFLMWLRTTVNYQMRYGGTMMGTIRILYAEGGIARFYSGVSVALLQGPLSRFGDTAANAGMLSMLENTAVPVAIQTVLASVAAALWRIVVMPLDTIKTVLQVNGAAGLVVIKNRVAANGLSELWTGALGSTVATFVGHYPWFATNNLLESSVPGGKNPSPKLKLLRRAAIGFASSIVSDFVSNSTRVLKTFVQTSAEPVGYGEALRFIIERDGLSGLFLCGLAAKIVCNGISSILFSVIWKMMMDRAKEREAKEKAANKAN